MSKVILILAAFVAIANAHFINHPARFSLPEEEGKTSHENSEENHHHHHHHQPHHGEWSGHGKNFGFPHGIKVNEKTLEGLRIRIKHEMKEEEGFDFEDSDSFAEVEDEDLILNWDEDVEEFPTGDFTDGKASQKLWKRELGLSRVLIVDNNGTKTFLKTKESTSVEAEGSITISGSLNTTLKVKGSGNAAFAANVSYSAKGKDKKITTDGGAVSTSTSATSIGKDRLLSKSSAKTDITVNDPKDESNAPIKITSEIESKSETFAAPFRTYLSLFATNVKTTTGAGKATFVTDGVLKGESTAHVIHERNGTSLTRVTVKAYMTSKTGEDFKQLVLIKAKSHIWTRVSSQTEDSAVVDVFTTTKVKTYAKGQSKTQRVYSGSGTVSCQKTQITVALEDIEDLHSSKSGMQVIHHGSSGNGFLHSAVMAGIRL